MKAGALLPAAFLDRDGTLIREVNWLKDPAQVELLSGAAEAVCRLRAAGWAVVVITNQSVIARGLCDEAGMERIHRRLEELLAQGGAQLDGIYYCPHHPGPMPESTRPDLIHACDCRKPATGMLTRAAAELGLDLARSWMVGDTSGDIQTAINAGMKSVMVQTGHRGLDGRYPAKPTLVAASIRDAADALCAAIPR